MLLFKARTLLTSRITESAELTARLEETLASLRAADKWQSLNEYQKAKTEILYLAQMGLIDFSGKKGAPRFKIR